MSLTSMYKQHPEFRAWFKNIWPKVPITLSNDIIVESRFGQGHGAIIGTAFDYLLRFKIEKINPGVVHQKEWISEGYYEKYRAYEEVKEAFPEELVNHILLVKKIIIKARNNQKKYISGKISLCNLCNDALALASIDTVYRTGMFQDRVGEVNEEHIDELKQMVELVDDKKFIVKNTAILNPTFEEASRLVGGADADLILDNTLLDIKTSKNLATKRSMFDQIIGYFILSKIQGVYNIDNLGIYFARFNEIWSISIEDLFVGQDMNSCVSSFEDLVKSLRLIPNCREPHDTVP
ncbi:hypothetical protein [Acidiphilium sp.]|uniref:hypothetical protein n=1 Tax=Acidiphilium sp. TaxID=527 RepID=UPI00259121A4|nr:hypothetical protein [Acidiphilium sp.]